MMEEGSSLTSSYFMESDRETANSRIVVEEEEEYYDFLPFQKEFLIPLRDRAFSWDVSFEDSAGILGENESAPIGVISEQQDSHRLVIRAKAPSNKKPNDSKDLTIETSTPATSSIDQTKKGKNNSSSKKKDNNNGISSPSLQTGKANLKSTTVSTSSNNTTSNKTQSKNTANKNNTNNNIKLTNTTTSARKNYVPSSPSTELLDNQTLLNTMTNSKTLSTDNSNNNNIELLNLNAFIKPEFPDMVLSSNDMNVFSFGNEFDTTTNSSNGRHNSVTFDDTVMNMNFKTEDDFLDLQNEIFNEEFRPPRKLSWSIDFNAIEAAMNAEGSFIHNSNTTTNTTTSSSNSNANTNSNLLTNLNDNLENNYSTSATSSYLYDNNNSNAGSGPREASSHPAFSSMLREMEATGSISNLYNNSTNSGTTSSSSNSSNMSSMKSSNNHHNASSNNMNNNSYSNNNTNELQHHHHNNTTSLLASMSNKSAERDQLASLMSGNTMGSAHLHGPTSHSHAGTNSSSHTSSYSNALNTNNNSSDVTSSSSSSILNGLTLGGLTVPNDGEFRVGAYTKLERHLKIEAFREKKRTRIWRKQIKYDCRKRLADTRPRVKGRFVSRKGDKGGPMEGEDVDPSAGDPGNAHDGPDGAPASRSAGNSSNNGHSMSNMSIPNGHMLVNNHHHTNANNMHLSSGSIANANSIAGGAGMYHNNHHNHHHPTHTHMTNNTNNSNNSNNNPMMHNNSHLNHHLSGGMLKQGGGGYMGPAGGAGTDLHNQHNTSAHMNGPVGSSIQGIKTEMKYTGSAITMPNNPHNNHMQQNSHLHSHAANSNTATAYLPGTNTSSTQPLPSIPSSHHYSATTTGTMNNHGVQRSMNGMMLNNSNNTTAYTPGPAHNLLSQSHQQKQQQQLLSSNTQSRYLAPTNNNNATTMHNTTTNQNPSGGLGLSAQNNVTSMSNTNVPTGLLLSGPTSALLHNNNTTTVGGGSSNVAGGSSATTLPSVPIVASPTGSGVMNHTLSGNNNTGNLATSAIATANTPSSMNPSVANMGGANMYHKQG